MQNDILNVLGMLTGAKEGENGEALIELVGDDPKKTSLTAETVDKLKEKGVKLVEREPKRVLRRSPVQDSATVTENTNSFPTVTRVMRRLKPGLYVVSTREHTVLVHRQPGFVYDTKNPCLFIYDGVEKPRPVSREPGGLASARVHGLFRVMSAEHAAEPIKALMA